MDIVHKHYPHDEHLFILDNAIPTRSALPRHLLQQNDKDPSTKFGAEVTPLSTERLVCFGWKPLKVVIQMGPGQLPDGQPQSFYDSNGVFIGMTRILEERGLVAESKLKASCKGFKCEKGATNCCQRRVLYNQPDFNEGSRHWR